jgi:diguanylate cyclase (GGDEF)-like protein
MISRFVVPGQDQNQSLRLRRWMMAAGASGMVLVLFFAAYLLNLLDRRAFVTAILLTLAFVVLFYAVFRSGLNLRFPDPSLTLPQIIAATLVILYTLSQSKEGHGILALIYMVPFLFGVFRLSTRQLLGVTAFVAVSYAVIIGYVWGPEMNADPLAFHRKVLNWIVLTSVLAFFAVMGGYISRLRRNLTDSKERLEAALVRIENMAGHDELTGVFNRRTLVEVLKQQKYRVDRYGKTFSVLIVDIDHFKRINDSHGHHAGDVVLRSFAHAAASSLRDTDVFGRYGGEEFMVIVEQTPLDRSNVVAGRICELARELVFDELASGLHISVSIGGAEYLPREEWQETVNRADQALYRAKQSGRDRFELAASPPGKMPVEDRHWKR